MCGRGGSGQWGDSGPPQQRQRFVTSSTQVWLQASRLLRTNLLSFTVQLPATKSSHISLNNPDLGRLWIFRDDTLTGSCRRSINTMTCVLRWAAAEGEDALWSPQRRENNGNNKTESGSLFFTIWLQFYITNIICRVIGDSREEAVWPFT